jgi:hypothetical protein
MMMMTSDGVRGEKKRKRGADFSFHSSKLEKECLKDLCICVSERSWQGERSKCAFSLSVLAGENAASDAGERNRVKLKRCRSDEERDAAAGELVFFFALLEEETELQSHRIGGSVCRGERQRNK